MKKTKILSLILCGILTANVLAGCAAKTTSDSEIVEIDFLTTWQGRSVRDPEDPVNNMIMKKIREDTGIQINIIYNSVSETERLNTMFASGDFPDVVSAPMWGMDDTATGILKKAAKEDMIMPLNDLIEKYGPNIKPALTTGLAADFIKFDLEDEDFGGEHYFIPTGRTPKELRRPDVNTSGLFIREDILKATGVDPSSINTSDDLYELLKKIKAGNFKDANGGNVIPGGMLHSGGGVNNYVQSYVDEAGGYTGLYVDENGKVRDDFFNPLLDKQTLHLRKMFSEDLLDIEGLSQTAARAQEKISTGKYAIVPDKYTNIYNYCADTLYKTNPEMKYVALPPLTNANGDKKQYNLSESGGSAVLFIPKASKKAEAVIKLLNYLFTEEAHLLLSYGIEGESYEFAEDGYVDFIGEYAEMTQAERFKTGIASYSSLLGLSYSPKYTRPDEYTADEQAAYDVLKKEYVYKDGIRLSYLELSHPNVARVREVKSNAKMKEVKMQAYCADSDEEALGYLNKLREQVLATGIEDLWKSVEDYMTAHPDETYLW